MVYLTLYMIPNIDFLAIICIISIDLNGLPHVIVPSYAFIIEYSTWNWTLKGRYLAYLVIIIL